MKFIYTVIPLICIGLSGCGTVDMPPRGASTGQLSTSTPPGSSSSRDSTTVPTAPIPILYPPHDPEATYPVIRTWTEVLDFKPYPYLKPLPPPQTTPIDGVYAKFDTSQPQWWRCARCPDFRLGGGNWRVMLHQGTMRMYYEVSGFSTVASYTVNGDEFEISNDPHCPYETGTYRWSLEKGALVLTEIQDTCAIHLRAENLVHQPWVSCQPPNAEAGATDHWIRPAGC